MITLRSLYISLKAVKKMNNRKLSYSVLFVILIVITALSFLMSIIIGSTSVSVSEVFSVLFGESKDETVRNILLKIRIPRAAAALLLGGALAVSGYLLQTLFRNPIAGPFVLGISSGAKLVVSLAMIASLSFFHKTSSFILIAAAFVGSMTSLGIVLLISKKVRRMSMLVVCGVTIGYICSAITDFIVTFADDSDIINLHNWSMGSFSGTKSSDVGIMLATVTAAVICTFMLSKPIGIYQLGDNYAANAGVRVNLLRNVLIILSGFLSAVVTAFAGPVSFVGIAVPHIVRSIVKTSRPIILIPACFLCGGIFCMLCDMIARTVLAPNELSISTVTAVFGAPVVIIAMVNRKKGEL